MQKLDTTFNKYSYITSQPLSSNPLVLQNISAKSRGITLKDGILTRTNRHKFSVPTGPSSKANIQIGPSNPIRSNL